MPPERSAAYAIAALAAWWDGSCDTVLPQTCRAYARARGATNADMATDLGGDTSNLGGVFGRVGSRSDILEEYAPKKQKPIATGTIRYELAVLRTASDTREANDAP